MAASILSEPRKKSKKKSKRLPEDKLPAIVSINSHRTEKHTPNPYASASIVGAQDALEGNIAFGKYGSREMHDNL